MHRKVWEKLKASIPSQPRKIICSIPKGPKLSGKVIKIKSIRHAYESWSCKNTLESNATRRFRASLGDKYCSEDEHLDSPEFKHALRKLGIK
jgi:hypothetical protein